MTHMAVVVRRACSIVAALAMLSSTSLGQEGAWSLQLLVDRVNDLWALPRVEPQIADMGGWPADPKSCFQREGDTVWELAAGPNTVSGALTTIWMAGQSDKLHSIRIWFPVVAGGDADVTKALGVIGGVVEHLLPDWDGARDWPATSLRQSWQVVADAMQRQQPPASDPYIRATVGHAFVTTFGVPPDFVEYGVTLLADCRTLSRS